MSFDLGGVEVLIYHPAFDANHCVYRMVSVLRAADKFPISWALWRLMDFYYLFPGQLKNIKPWPREMQKFKKHVLKIPNQFEDLTNPARLFFELQEFQKAAALELIAKGVLSKSSFDSDFMVLEKTSLSSSYIEVLEIDAFLKSETFKVIVEGLPSVNFNGVNGLKARSGLMEYIYDI